MRRLALAVALALALPLIGPTSAAPADAPLLSVGDRWDVRTIVSEASGVSGEGYEHAELAAFERVTVDGVAFDTFRLAVNGTVDLSLGPCTGHTEKRATEWHRVADGATIKTRTTLASTYSGCPDAADSTSVTASASAQPCDAIAYPLAVGSAWTNACVTDWTYADGSTQRMHDNATYRVDAAETVSVDAGSFDTFRLRIHSESAGTNSTAWYAPRACTLARLDTPFDAASTGTTTSQLVSYRCAKAEPPPAVTSSTPPATTSTSPPATSTTSGTTTSTPPGASTSTPTETATSSTPPVSGSSTPPTGTTAATSTPVSTTVHGDSVCDLGPTSACQPPTAPSRSPATGVALLLAALAALAVGVRRR
jgi:hypothetical protein